MMGIIIITVVCCAVATSIIWVVIIYQTRKRTPPPASTGPPLEGPLELDRGVQFTDNVSDRSSCRDSGTGDSARRSNDDLVPEEYKLIINEEPQPGWNVMRIASLTYIPADPNSSHAPLLPGTPYVRSTNHDRPDTPEKEAAPAEQTSEN